MSHVLGSNDRIPKEEAFSRHNVQRPWPLPAHSVVAETHTPTYSVNVLRFTVILVGEASLEIGQVAALIVDPAKTVDDGGTITNVAHGTSSIEDRQIKLCYSPVCGTLKLIYFIDNDHAGPVWVVRQFLARP
jgi:hypothetical protein